MLAGLHPHALQHDFEERRRKVLQVSVDALISLLQRLKTKRGLLVTGLPDDARVVGMFSAGTAPPNTVQLIIESNEFEPCRTGEFYPLLNIEFTDVPEDEPVENASLRSDLALAQGDWQAAEHCFRVEKADNGKLRRALRAILDSTGGDLHKKGPFVHVDGEALSEAEKALASP